MLTSTDKKSLEEIYKLFQDLEKSSIDACFDSVKLDNLILKIQSLTNSTDSKIQRLGDIAKHLNSDMTLKHFVTFMVPIERVLQKATQDDDFLVIENDRTEKSQTAIPLVFILDNIRSAFNVGSCLRTAECLNIEKIYLCGYTPTPEQEKVLKTAMGTDKNITWTSSAKSIDAINELKFKGYRVVALETAAQAQSLYQKFEFCPTAFVVGNERFGLDKDVLKACDEIRYIPLSGTKNSLNVGVSLAVAGFEWNRQYGQK